MNKSPRTLSLISALTAIISAGIGVFYSFGCSQKTVENIYGQQIVLYGDGVFANDSIMKVGATKGTELVIILVGVVLLLTVIVWKDKKFALFLQAGLLSLILYSSTCLLFGVTFNRLFLLYLVRFATTLFAFIFVMADLLKRRSFKGLYDKNLKGTALFLILGGCSTLIWLTFIIPTVISNTPMEIIDIYTSEPTFVIDLAIILPTTWYCGFSLLAKKHFAYQLTPVLLTALTGVGVCVIAQTFVQTALGIVLNPGQLFGLVISFVILGAVALGLNSRLLRRLS